RHAITIVSYSLFLLLLPRLPPPPLSLSFFFFFLMILPPPRSTLFPYTTLFRSLRERALDDVPRHHHSSLDPLRPSRSTVRRRAPRAYRRGCPDFEARLPILAGQPEPDGFRARLAPAADAELAQDCGNGVIDRSPGQHQPFRDLGVAQSLRHEPEYLELTARQAGRILLRRAPRSARHAADATLVEPARDECGRRLGAELLE